MRTLAAMLGCAAVVMGAENAPELRSWVLPVSTNAAVQAIAPEVHAVRADDDYVYVDSAGLSLHSFGALEANEYDPPAGARQFHFRIPRHPKPAGGEHVGAPLGVIGVFVTGVPIHNPIGTVSYRNQNIWHRDAVAASKAGTSQLTSALENASNRHSPIIGFALDGYPIYGPFGWDDAGKVRRMRSSYRLRAIVRRTTLPDGTVLTPGQEGPDAGPAFPLGTFTEDYEYAKGSGDLDEYNGRYGKTPEYPDGTYAYFLSTWPYLVGPKYFGASPFTVPRESPQAGSPATLAFTFHDKQNRPTRFLENVHERQIHLIVVSKDLDEFAHIHPEPSPGDIFTVTHTFAHGGDYTLFADYTAPGEGPTIARREIVVTGETRKPQPLRVDRELTKTVDGVQVTLRLPETLNAGVDLPLAFELNVNDLQPYLGAWAHILIVSENRETFIHAHPLEAASAGSDSWAHVHTVPVAGPGPSTIRTITGFRKPGLYKLWFQFQRQGSVGTVAWVIRVAASDAQANEAAQPEDAIAVRVSSAGFTPSRVTIAPDRPTRIAFIRSDAENCAREVIFPELGIRRSLAPGQTTLVEIPASNSGELHFACGMGMFQGALVVR